MKQKNNSKHAIFQKISQWVQNIFQHLPMPQKLTFIAISSFVFGIVLTILIFTTREALIVFQPDNNFKQVVGTGFVVVTISLFAIVIIILFFFTLYVRAASRKAVMIEKAGEAEARKRAALADAVTAKAKADEAVEFRRLNNAQAGRPSVEGSVVPLRLSAPETEISGESQPSKSVVNSEIKSAGE